MAVKLIKPKKLHPGNVLAAVSLSWGGPGTIPYRYEEGKKQLLNTFGVRVVEMPHTMSDPGWLKENPSARADDLMLAFADPSIAGIISSIGGDDSIRILPYLDLDIIRQNPKVFMGYSDTTISHFACLKWGTVPLYGSSG
jgi:muramoyltetrapeptide carboxypeptidase LdcA involved in peptidoglycan recycling